MLLYHYENILFLKLLKYFKTMVKVNQILFQRSNQVHTSDYVIQVH